jgi:hypothetical protein
MAWATIYVRAEVKIDGRVEYQALSRPSQIRRRTKMKMTISQLLAEEKARPVGMRSHSLTHK